MIYEVLNLGGNGWQKDCVGHECGEKGLLSLGIRGKAALADPVWTDFGTCTTRS